MSDPEIIQACIKLIEVIPIEFEDAGRIVMFHSDLKEARNEISADKLQMLKDTIKDIKRCLKK